MPTSRIATLAAGLGITAIALFAGGPALIQAGLLSSLVGFPIFMLGGLLGLLALALGGLGLYMTRPAAARPGRERAILGAGLGALIVAIIGFTAGGSGGLPPINDITTNPDDPPVFVGALQIEANRARDMAYPGAEFARQQRDGYPDLAPIELGKPPAAVYAEALEAMNGLGWRITHQDQSAGTIEATETTGVFKFVDDIVVRVRPTATGSLVDVRSKSREGRGDLGTNAARIRALRDALKG